LCNEEGGLAVSAAVRHSGGGRIEINSTAVTSLVNSLGRVASLIEAAATPTTPFHFHSSLVRLRFHSVKAMLSLHGLLYALGVRLPSSSRQCEGVNYDDEEEDVYYDEEAPIPTDLLSLSEHLDMLSRGYTALFKSSFSVYESGGLRCKATGVTGDRQCCLFAQLFQLLSQCLQQVAGVGSTAAQRKEVDQTGGSATALLAAKGMEVPASHLTLAVTPLQILLSPPHIPLHKNMCTQLLCEAMRRKLTQQSASSVKDRLLFLFAVSERFLKTPLCLSNGFFSTRSPPTVKVRGSAM
jgi:hypothetical protein